MKQSIAAALLVASASAGSLRKPNAAGTGLLPLPRCVGKSADECCYQEKGQHALYDKKDPGNPGRLGEQCCSITMGTWIPTNSKEEKDNYCKTETRFAKMDGDLNKVKSVTDRLRNSLEYLHESKKALEIKFDREYAAHAAKEDSARDKNRKLRGELREVQGNLGEEVSRFQGLERKLNEVTNDNAGTKKKLEEQETALKKQMKATQQKYKSKLDLKKKFTVELKKVQSAIGTCKIDNVNSQKKIDLMKKSMEETQTSISKARTTLAGKEAALVGLEKETVAAEKGLGEDKQKLEDGTKKILGMIDALEQANSKLDTKISEATASLAEAKEELKEAEKANAFVETANTVRAHLKKNDGDSPFDAEKYAEADLEKKGKTYVDPTKNMVTDATTYIANKLSNLHPLMVNLKALKSRIHALIRLDKDLNKEIMGDLKKKFKALTDAITGVENQMRTIVAKCTDVTDLIEAGNSKHNKWVSKQNALLNSLSRQNGQLLAQLKYEIKATEKVADMIGDNKGLLKECDAKAFKIAKNMFSVKQQDNTLNTELSGLQQDNLDAANLLKDEQEKAAKSIAEAEEANRKLKASLGVLKNEVRAEKSKKNGKEATLTKVNNEVSDTKMETEMAGI